MDEHMREANRRKAIEVILYIAHRLPDPTFHSVSKILYFADKTSLETVGRLICGSTYFAMQNGPVPSEVYDLMKEAPPSGEFGFVITNERTVFPQRAPDLDALSDSDIGCLDRIIALYRDVPFWKRTQDSHDAAWEEAWNARGSRSSNEMSLESIIAQFDDGDELLDHLRRQYE